MFSPQRRDPGRTRRWPALPIDVPGVGRTLTYESFAGETGYYLDRFPFVQVGRGERDLLVIPGFGDTLFDGEYPPFAPQALAGYFHRFLDSHTVTLLSRPRGLSTDATVASMAADFAEVLVRELGRVDLLGVSMGGMHGLELAANRPDLIDRLVLADSGVRVAPEGRPRVEKLRRYAAERKWAELRARLTVDMFSDWRAFTYPPAILGPGRLWLPTPAVPSDPLICLDAILGYDGGDALSDVAAPTLVVAGDRDPYFTPEVQREMADGIENATLELLQGGKHGAFHQQKSRFDRRLAAFLEETQVERGRPVER